MNSPIRPLPCKAAPQRTESDASTPSLPHQDQGFGEVLKLHFGSKQDEKRERKTEPGKKIAAEDGTPAGLFGIQVVAPQLVAVMPLASGAGFVRSSAEGGANPMSSVSSQEAILQEPNGFLTMPASSGTTPPLPAPGGSSGDLTLQPAVGEPVRPAAEPKKGDAREPAITTAVERLASSKEQKLPASEPRKTEEVAGKQAETAEMLHGIPDAKQIAMPLMQEKKDISISPEEQRLYGSVQTNAAALDGRPASIRPSAKITERALETPGDKLAAQSETLASSFQLDVPQAPAEAPKLLDVRAAAVVHAIQQQVQVLRVSPQNQLDVVLRPDAHTELFLQVRHVDGQVQVQARCERGDFTWLNSQWNAVQSTLASQGVKVEPLQAAYRGENGQSAMWMQDQRGSQQREQRGTPSSVTFEQENLKTGKTSSRPGNRLARQRGWQSWA